MNDKIKLKQLLTEACISKQKEAVEALKFAVDEAQNSANEYGAPKDRYDSYRTQLLRKRDMFAKQLHLAYEQLETLNKIPVDKIIDKVEFGAVVLMPNQNIFVSTGLGKIKLHGVEYYAVSPAVPIVKALQGKRAGESAILNGRTIEIIDVF